MDPLARLADLLPPPHACAVVDIGANPIDGDPPYRSLLDHGLCRVTGFEPQPDALAALSARKGPHETYLPHVVGDGAAHTLHICRYSGWTSLLRPAAPTIALFPAYASNSQVLRTEPVSTRRLDDIAEIDDIDLLKIDVQGAELSVFRHGRRALQNAVMIQTEVSFIPLYENQPSFADVDQELRAQGFVPHAMPALRKGMIAPLVVKHDPFVAFNQLLEADVVYVRDLLRLADLPVRKLAALALLAHGCYGSFDLSARCLAVLAARGAVAADAVQTYLTLISASLARR